MEKKYWEDKEYAYFSHKKCEYRKLWGKGKFGWRPDKNKQDTQQEKAA